MAKKLGSSEMFPCFYRYVGVVCLIWMALISLSFYIDYEAEQEEVQIIALSNARSSIAKDVVFRRWAAGHGGVYVPVTDQTPPNPYLSHIKNRDIVSTSGQRLTLVNPAYVMRQVHELEEDQLGVRGHITSLRPLRPENVPDSWEKSALQEFESGAKEVSSIELIDGEQYLRLMLPLLTEKRCLKCHAAQGYAHGDIRGGVSASVPMAPYKAVAYGQIKTHLSGDLALLLVGLCGICCGALVVYRRAKERHRAGSSLRKWGQIFEHAQWGVVTSLLESDRCELMNPAFAAMHGYSIDELLGGRLFNIVAPEKQEELLAFIEKAQESGPQSFESLSIRKDGTIFPTIWNVSIFREKIDSKLCLASNILDITERYQAEQAICQLNDGLERRVFLRTVQLEDAQKVLKVEDERLRALLRMSQKKFDSGKELSEYALQEVVRICNSQVGYIHFENQDQESSVLFLRSKDNDKYCYDSTGWHTPFSDAGVWCDCISQQETMIHNDSNALSLKIGETEEPIAIHRHTVTPVFDDGEMVALIGVANKQECYNDSDACQLSLFANSFWQMMKRKITEEELSRAVEVSEKANRAKSEFLSNMSHEIRTPMNAILGLTHLALQTDITLQQRDYLEKVYGSCRSLLAIINDILDFSKIEAGRLSLENTEFYLEDIFDNLSRSTELQAQEKGLEIIYSIGPDVPAKLIGDPLRVCQVLINLLSNAIKFTAQGEIEVSVDLTKDSPENIILLFSVRDTGDGIAPNDLNKLFEAFRQADVSITRKYGGTGLGLTISKKLISLMDGVIEVESELGCGSTFRFTAKFSLLPEKKVIRQSVPGELQGMRVLVVDDNPTVRRVLQVTLESFSFNAILAESGEVALLLVEQASQQGIPFRLVLMDWKLTGMDGIEAALAIRNIPNLAVLPPIIMVTAYGRKEVIPKIEEANLDGCLFKPVSPSALFNKIMDVFGQQITLQRPRRMQRLVAPERIKKIAGASVLVAEDNRINQQVIRELLESWGVNVQIVVDGEEAVRVIEEQIKTLKNLAQAGTPYCAGLQFDAIFMDIQMPRVDGYTATREIRKIEKMCLLDGQNEKGVIVCDGMRHTPVIAMTAHAKAEDRERSLKAGMDDHITKPLVPEDLVACLLRWIEPHEEDEGSLFNSKERCPRCLDEDIVLPVDLADLDIHDGLRRVAGNRRLYRKLLANFVQDNNGIVETINEMLDDGDHDKARIQIHTLKGVAGNIGAKMIYEAAKKFETAISQGSSSLGIYSMNLATHVEQLLKALRAFCRQHPHLNELSSKKSKGLDDRETLRTKIIEMAGLCRVNDTKAIKVFASIRDDFATDFPSQVVRLEELLQKYDFNGALEEIETHVVDG